MPAGIRATTPVYVHLATLTDAHGLFEHARLAEPRREHGYCLDDAARALVVTCREPHPDRALTALLGRYLDFVLQAVQPDGLCHNRMNVSGAWTDDPGSGDWWGRALWGLGVAAVHAPTATLRGRALMGFRVAAQARSPFLRALAFAGLGAGEVRAARPDEECAEQILLDAREAIGPQPGDGHWPWPEPRLGYGNGSVVEALLLCGSTLDDPAAVRHGLALLDFLLRSETRAGHLSVTPVGGRGPGDEVGGRDQQPIEVAALADACARGYQLTGDPRWRDGVRLAWGWFCGDNDNGTAMVDPETGAGFDGLHVLGRNENRGAESTLAALSTAQHAVRLGLAG
jgi:hypothetical protein